MSTLVLTNAVIIDGTGADPIPSGSVVVEGDRIKEVMKGSPGKIPSESVTIDCRNRTLLPGLIDAHVHTGAVDANIMEQQRLHYPSMLVIRALKVIQEALDQGFTTIRDAGGADAGFREAQRQGLIPGPRMFVSGCALSQTGGHGDFRLPTELRSPSQDLAGVATRVCDGVDEVRRGAREQLRRGADFVKVMGGGGCMSPERRNRHLSVQPGRAEGYRFRGGSGGDLRGCPRLLQPVASATACPQAIRTLEHGNLLDESAAKAIKDAGAFLVPTLVTYEMISRMGKSMGIPDNNVRKINEARDRGSRPWPSPSGWGSRSLPVPTFSARCSATREWNWS